MPFINHTEISILLPPLGNSQFNQNLDYKNAAPPGNEQFIATEDLKDITTEDGIFLITES